jgi:hypothetical protein
MQNHGRVRQNATKDYRVMRPKDLRQKARKRNFKTESWYAAAASQMSASRRVTKFSFDEARVTPLAPD